MPASLVATARCACSSRSCRSSAGAISCAAIVRARSAQLPGMFFVRRSIDSTSEPPSRAFFADRRHLRQRLVDQERRRHEARGARRLHAAELAVELLRIRLQPREIRLGVGGVLDADDRCRGSAGCRDRRRRSG